MATTNREFYAANRITGDVMQVRASNYVEAYKEVNTNPLHPVYSLFATKKMAHLAAKIVRNGGVIHYEQR